MRGGLDSAERFERHESAFDRLLFQHDFAIELRHARVFGGLLRHLGVALAQLLFAGGLGDSLVVEIVLETVIHVVQIEDERVVLRRQVHILAAGDDLVPALFRVPLGERRGHVHLFDDVPPAHARVVGAEADFAFLRGVGDDALLGAPEVVIEEILEPHAGDEQEVPAILAALFDVFEGAVAGDFAVVAAGGSEAFVEFLQQVGELERAGRLHRVVVAKQRQRHSDHRQFLAARGIVDAGHVLRELFRVEEGRHGTEFLGFLVDHDGHADAAVGMAAAAQLAPVGRGSVDEIGPVGEGAHERDGEPVAGGNAHADLIPHVMREVRKRVTLRFAALVGHFFVAAGERNGLEGKERDFLRIVERELDDRAHLLVVHAVDDRDDRNDVDAVRVQVFDRAQLHVEQIADGAMRVGSVADAIELEIRVAQAGFRGLAAELGGFCKLDSVGGSLDAVVADFAGVLHGVEEVGRESRLAAGELHRHLASRLDRDRVVEHGLDVVPSQFMDETDLVGIHETGVAHHVAAVGEIDREDRAAAVRDGAGAVVVEIFIVVGADVAAGENLFEVIEEFGIDRHQVFKVAVNGAILDHQDFAVAVDDLRLDFADLLVAEDFDGHFAVDDLGADLGDAFRAKRIRGAGPAERRLLLFPGFQEGLFRPFGRERRIRFDRIEGVEHLPGCAGCHRYCFFGVLDRFVHFLSEGS